MTGTGATREGNGWSGVIARGRIHSNGSAFQEGAARWPVALPDDPEARLRCYRNALRNWNFTGYVEFKERVQGWLRDELKVYVLREIRCAMFEHVEHGGEIDEQVERRPEYAHYEFHYDLRVKFGGRRIYFETVLLCDDADDPDDPIILVVNVHDA